MWDATTTYASFSLKNRGKTTGTEYMYENKKGAYQAYSWSQASAILHSLDLLSAQPSFLSFGKYNTKFSPHFLSKVNIIRIVCTCSACISTLENAVNYLKKYQVWRTDE